MAETKPRRKTLTFYREVEVEVEVDEDDLEDAGYHRVEDCPAAQVIGPDLPDLAAVLASLHRQAHPSAHPEIFMCREEPCRSLGMAQIGYRG